MTLLSILLLMFLVVFVFAPFVLYMQDIITYMVPDTAGSLGLRKTAWMWLWPDYRKYLVINELAQNLKSFQAHLSDPETDFDEYALTELITDIVVVRNVSSAPFKTDLTIRVRLHLNHIPGRVGFFGNLDGLDLCEAERLLIETIEADDIYPATVAGGSPSEDDAA